MGTVSDIFTLLKQAYEIWRTWDDARTVSPQELYSKYVAPTYALMKDVHADYLDLYLELHERLRLEQRSQVLSWFARARTRRQGDRSELRVMRFPQINQRSDFAKDVNAATVEYITAVQEYFQPVVPASDTAETVGDETIFGDGSTASKRTEHHIRVLAAWSVLDRADQLAYAANEIFASFPVYELDEARDGAIEAILGVAANCPDPEVLARARELAGEATKKLIGLKEHPGVEHVPLRITCGALLSDNILQQRYALEMRMRRVQQAHARLRILTDR